MLNYHMTTLINKALANQKRIALINEAHTQSTVAARIYGM